MARCSSVPGPVANALQNTALSPVGWRVGAADANVSYFNVMCHRAFVHDTGRKEAKRHGIEMDRLYCTASAMHCCLGLKYSPEEMEQRHISLKIDQALKKEKQYKRRAVKLLLLGAGESGKSTVLKQMKIIHGVEFQPEDRSEFQAVVYQNLIRGMRVLVDAREKLAIPWENDKNAVYTPILLRVDNAMLFDTKVFLEYAVCIQELWKDAAIVEAYNRRREFQLVCFSS